MSAQPGHVPIVETLGASWRFFRSNAGAFAPWAALLALASTMVWLYVPLPGGSPPPAAALPLYPLWALSAPAVLAMLNAAGVPALDPLSGLLLVSASALAIIGYWTFLLRRASDGERPASSFIDDWSRLARVFGALWFLILILTLAAFIVMAFVFASVMQSAGISPAQIEAAQSDPQAVMRLVNKAMAESGGLLVWLSLLGMLFGFAWMFARLALSGPATIMEARVSAFKSWGYTKGDGFRIAIVYTTILAPALALVWLNITLINPASNDASSAAVLLGAHFVLMLAQTWVVMPMMAGAGAYLYRGLKPSH